MNYLGSVAIFLLKQSNVSATPPSLHSQLGTAVVSQRVPRNRGPQCQQVLRALTMSVYGPCDPRGPEAPCPYRSTEMSRFCRSLFRKTDPLVVNLLLGPVALMTMSPTIALPSPKWTRILSSTGTTRSMEAARICNRPFFLRGDDLRMNFRGNPVPEKIPVGCIAAGKLRPLS